MSDFEIKWQWKVVAVGNGYPTGTTILANALNSSWTITKATSGGGLVVYVLKKLKEGEEL